MSSGILILPTRYEAVKVEWTVWIRLYSVYSCQGANTSEPAADKNHADVMSKQTVQMN